ncbi:kinesin-like protein KIF26B [Boleophthalmus pectinirostris]|uniref:kinesin-like protein KIF26B n=1 Tax=Boleophthalmus pectinirostris TaxID=150288 RepID=UPI00242EFAD8|nr:kinesin-like protein KIF26B [Boleophthalmus pectinirostris]
MSSLTGRGERFPGLVRGTAWDTQTQHHGDFSALRPAPEGSRDDTLRNTMCQRSSYKSLPGYGVGERGANMSYGTGTLCRSTVSALTGFGRAEQKVTCCEKCSTTLLGLKKQALSLAVHQQFSCKDSSDLSSFLHDNLRIQSRPTDSWEHGECSTCGTTVNDLKQEAIFLALNRGQVPTRPPFEPSFGPPFPSATLLGHLDSTLTKYEERPSRDFTRTLQHFRSRTHSPLRNQCSPQNTRAPSSPKTPQRTPQTLRRRGAKSPHRDMDRWVDEQKQLVSSKSTLPRVRHQTADKSSGEAGAVQINSKLPHITRVVTIANTAAMSFLAKAAEKLNLTLRKKGHASDSAPAQFSTCFRDVIQKNPPAAPSCLLQAATRTKDSPSVGKVRVVLRVNPDLPQSPGPPSILQVDSSRRRVTVMEPFYKGHPYSTLTLGRDKSLVKTFNFDATYPQHASQADLCAGVLPDVIRCVLSGSDGCVLALGCSDVGSWSSMVGSDDSPQKLGLIPCAISWLYAAIERRREKTWTDLSVSVSALELCCGEEDTLRDLLGEMLPTGGSIQDSPTAHIKLQEDPVCGVQVRNHNRVKAPTAERAASLLDAAITARRHTDFVTYLSHSSIMFFTLHVQPPRTETSTIGKGSRGPTKLTMIDVCRGMRYSKNRYPYAELSPIVLSLLNGQRTIPNKSSKLSLLLRESLGHVNCHTAVVAQVSDSVSLLDETLSTIQTAAKIRRTQRRAQQSGSCSPHARSLTREKKAPKTLSLRAFHSTEEVDSDVRPLRFRGRLYDEQSGSEQSCDTVIQIDSRGLVQANAAPRVNQPEFVPIIPSLHPSKTEVDDPEFTALLKELLKIPQLHGDKKKQEAVIETLKCDTFAELQERLGCIDGSELTAETLKLVQNAVKLEPVKNNVDIRVSKAAVLSQTTNQKPGAEADAAFNGDSFQREDSGLYDCEECSAASSGEELLNQTLTRNATRHSENHKISKKADGLSVMNQPKSSQDPAESCEWYKPDKRASPIGKSNSPSTSCPNSQTTSVVLGDILPNVPSTENKEMKATITVTVKQPLDQKGQDEIVFSMVEEVTISGGMSSVSTTGNIICFQNASQNGQKGGGSSQPIRIISNVMGDDANATTEATPKEIVRPEKGSLPSFINPMLMNTDIEEVEESAKKEKHSNEIKLEKEIKKKEVKCKEHSKPLETKSGSGAKDDSKINSTDNKTCTKMSKSPEKSQPTDADSVCANNSPKTSRRDCPVDEITPLRTGVAPGCQGATTPVVFKSGTLPRGWQDSKVLSNDSHRGNLKDPIEVTSSTPGSPRVTVDKWEGRQYSHTNKDASFTPKKAMPSLFESGRSKSPFDDTSRLFSVKLEQLVSRTNSLERNPRDFPIFEHGSSSTSSKSSSNGASKSYRVHSEGDYTLPRTSRSPKRNAKLDQNYATVEYGKQSKLSAKDKLKIASPKVRRQSAPSIKNMSLPHKNVHQSSINRSASLSPDGKTVSFERMSTFLSSSPPRSHQSLSRTPSQSSTCSSSKSAIQGFVSGSISELLKDRSGSPSSLDQMSTIPSPYSQVTAPRLPSPNGYASDTTSVLSGDLPPAMGKTSLYFSNRNSTVSSGYGSMLRERDSEASDRSGSGLSAGRSGRSSKKRGPTGVHQRRQHESSQSLKRSTSGPRSRFVEHEIPEGYEIKVYDIDNAQRTQKRSGPNVFQCQAEVFGASSEEDVRGTVSHRPHGGARGGQTLQHITAHHVEPRGGAFTDLRGHRGS